MITYVFPGQGSQSVGMGGELFDKYSEYVDQADQILGYSIKELCLNDPEKKLGNTKYTQPALYTVNALMYLEQIEKTGIKPDFLAGHSLGEYDALFAAGVFDFATGLKIVKKRAELMSEANGGAMAAVIGLGKEEISNVLRKDELKDIDMANLNSYKQIVISGKSNDIDRAQTFFEEAGAMSYIKLKVSGAFHSRYMEYAKENFAKFIEQFEFNEPETTVYSNLTAKPYTLDTVKEKLIDQIVSSVRWYEIITELIGYPNNQIIQIGSGNVLTGLTSKIARDIKKLGIKPETHVKGKQVKTLTAEMLGSDEFKKEYNIKYAYYVGGMYKGITSRQIVIRMAEAGMLAFLGTGGVAPDTIDSWIAEIKRSIPHGKSFGVNVIGSSRSETEIFELIRKHDVRIVEAAAYISLSENLVRYRVSGLTEENGDIVAKNKLIAKLSRPEIAEMFLSPAPEKILDVLKEKGEITEWQYDAAKNIPMADDICVEGDSGGHTDRGNLLVILPSMQLLRDRMMEKYNYKKIVRIGAAGGIGTPSTMAVLFDMGADFVVTGSINQCTVESGTSDKVKDILSKADIQDTDYCVSGDMFEWGGIIQVMKKGTFFPIRSNKIYDIYKKYNSLEEIDAATRKMLEEKYFDHTFEQIWEEVRDHCKSQELVKAESNPKYKMLLTFKWYYAYTTRLALEGNENKSVNYQIHCGSAMGAFNNYVKGTKYEAYENRHVDEIALLLLNEAANHINNRQ